MSPVPPVQILTPPVKLRASKKAFYPSIFGARDLGLMHLSLRHQYLGQLIGFSA